MFHRYSQFQKFTLLNKQTNTNKTGQVHGMRHKKQDGAEGKNGEKRKTKPSHVFLKKWWFTECSYQNLKEHFLPNRMNQRCLVYSPVFSPCELPLQTALCKMDGHMTVFGYHSVKRCPGRHAWQQKNDGLHQPLSIDYAEDP